MPQMAPLNWLMILILIFFFILTVSSINYFNWMSIPKNNNINNNKNNFSWKW